MAQAANANHRSPRNQQAITRVKITVRIDPCRSKSIHVDVFFFDSAVSEKRDNREGGGSNRLYAAAILGRRNGCHHKPRRGGEPEHQCEEAEVVRC